MILIHCKFHLTLHHIFFLIQVKLNLAWQPFYKDVLKSIKIRDKSDYNRKISPLKRTKDSVLINTTNLSKRACFLKIKKIIDKNI